MLNESFAWVGYALMSMTLLGIGMSFLKVPSINKEVQSESMNVWNSIFSLLFSIIAILIFYIPNSFTIGLVTLSVLQGSLFSLRSLLQMKSLFYSSVNTLFLLTSVTGLICMSLIGIFIYDDKLSILQTLGLIASICGLFAWSYKKGVKLSDIKSDWLFISIVITSVFGNVMNKEASNYGVSAFQNLMTYQLVFYVASLVMSLALSYYKNKKINSLIYEVNVPTLLTAFGWAVFGYFGSLFLLSALIHGPVSLVQTIIVNMC